MYTLQFLNVVKILLKKKGDGGKKGTGTLVLGHDH